MTQIDLVYHLNFQVSYKRTYTKTKFDLFHIQPQNLLRGHALRFVTSSIEKKELVAAKTEKHEESAAIQETKDTLEGKEQKKNGYRISPSAAYHIAASAASYLHSHTRSILPFKSSKDSPEESGGRGSVVNMMNSDMASLMATTDSVTSVVAAKEEVKQAVADDLSSTHSSPCDWFICDDDQSATRFLVIQVFGHISYLEFGQMGLILSRFAIFVIYSSKVEGIWNIFL